MPRLLALLAATALLTAGCETLAPGGGTVKACRENLISNLNDRESYREDSKPKEIQAEPDHPIVWGWYFNAKNAMGGYGQGKEILCYQEGSGQIIQEIFSADDSEARRMFLALTNPKIQQEIDNEIAAAAAVKAEREAAAARAKAERETAAKAAAQRQRQAKQQIYNKHLRELTRFVNAECGIDKDLMDQHALRICRDKTVENWAMFRRLTCDGWGAEHCED